MVERVQSEEYQGARRTAARRARERNSKLNEEQFRVRRGLRLSELYFWNGREGAGRRKDTRRHSSSGSRG